VILTDPLDTALRPSKLLTDASPDVNDSETLLSCPATVTTARWLPPA
jgi:hypothetical protein